MLVILLISLPLAASAKEENILRDDYEVEYLPLKASETKYDIPLVALSMEDGKIIGELQLDNGWRQRELSRFSNRMDIKDSQINKFKIKVVFTSVGAIKVAVGSAMILSGVDEYKKWGGVIAGLGLLEIGIGVGF